MTEQTLSNRDSTLEAPSNLGAVWLDFARPLRAFLSRRVPQGIEIDDVLQDVFVRVHRGIAAVKDGDKLHAWIFQVARSAAVDAIRSRARHTAPADAAPELEGPDAPDAEDSPERLLALCVAPMLDRLDAPYREAMQLVEVAGLTQAEAAERAGITLSAMKSRVQRARVQLKELLVACCTIDVDARGSVMGYEARDPSVSKSEGCRPLPRPAGSCRNC
jgi:RNA polymerase sigma-70 factor (ECF subfamily)